MPFSRHSFLSIVAFTLMFVTQAFANVESKTIKVNDTLAKTDEILNQIAPTTTTTTKQASLDGKIRIGLVGDGMAGALGKGLNRLKKANNFGFEWEVFDLSRGSSGFVRNDFYDWNGKIEGLLEKQPLDYLFIFIGSNDRQSMVVDGKRQKSKTPLWREEYIRRIDLFLSKVRKFDVKIVWIGQPIARSKKFSNDMSLFNEIYRQRVESVDGNFFDSWALFADENGNYRATGADNLGILRKLRASNGIHLTKRGNEKLGFQILDQIGSFSNSSNSLSDEGEEVIFEKFTQNEDDKVSENDIIEVEAKAETKKVEEKKNLRELNVYELSALEAAEEKAKLKPKKQVVKKSNLPIYKRVIENGEILKPEFDRSDDFSWPRN